MILRLARIFRGALAHPLYNWAALPMSVPAIREESRPRAASATVAKPAPGMNRVLFLLSLSVLINYIDRSNLSIAAPLLQSELGISNTQLGTLLSAFFWIYALMQIPARLASSIAST